MKFLVGRKPQFALLLVRLLVGITFMLHGAQKVFGAFGGTGMNAFAQYTKTLGFHEFFGYLAALFEFVGGMLITFGIATEFGALLGLAVMVVAVFWVHLPNGFFVQNKGYEYALNLLILSIVLIIGGPGRMALWDPFKSWRD